MNDQVVNYTHEFALILIACFGMFMTYRVFRLVGRFAAGLFPTYCVKENYSLEQAQKIVDDAHKVRCEKIIELNVSRAKLQQEESPIPPKPPRLEIGIEQDDKFRIPNSAVFLYYDDDNAELRAGGLNKSLQDTISFLAVFSPKRIVGLSPKLALIVAYYRAFPEWETVRDMFEIDELNSIASGLPDSVKCNADKVINWGGIRGPMSVFFSFEMIHWPVLEAFEIITNDAVEKPFVPGYEKFIMFGLDCLVIGITVIFLATLLLKSSAMAQRGRLAIFFAIPVANMWSSSLYSSIHDLPATGFKMWVSLIASIIGLLTVGVISIEFATDRGTHSNPDDTPEQKADKDFKSISRSVTKNMFTKSITMLFLLLLVVGTSADYMPKNSEDVAAATVKKLDHSVQLTKETFATYVPEAAWLDELARIDDELSPKFVVLMQDVSWARVKFWWDISTMTFKTQNNQTTLDLKDASAVTTANTVNLINLFIGGASTEALPLVKITSTGAITEGFFLPLAVINYCRNRPYNPLSSYPRPESSRKKRSIEQQYPPKGKFFMRVDPTESFEQERTIEVLEDYHPRNKRWTLLNICFFCSSGGVSKSKYNSDMKLIWGKLKKIQSALTDINSRLNTQQGVNWLLGEVDYLQTLTIFKQSLINSIQILSNMDGAINPTMMSLNMSAAYTDLEAQANTYATKSGLNMVTTQAPIYTVKRSLHGIWILGSFAMEHSSTQDWYQLEINYYFSQPRTECRQATLPSPFTFLFSAGARQFVVSDSESIAAMYCYDSICGGITKTTVFADNLEVAWLQELQDELIGKTHVFVPVPIKTRNFPIEYIYKADCWISGFGGWYLSVDGIASFWLNGTVTIKMTALTGGHKLQDQKHLTKWTLFSYTITGSTDVTLTTSTAEENFRITSSATSHADIAPRNVPIVKTRFQVGMVSKRRYYLNLGDPPQANEDDDESDSGGIFGSIFGHLLSGGTVLVIVFAVVLICWCQHSKKLCFGSHTSHTDTNTESSSPE